MSAAKLRTNIPLRSDIYGGYILPPHSSMYDQARVDGASVARGDWDVECSFRGIPYAKIDSSRQLWLCMPNTSDAQKHPNTYRALLNAFLHGLGMLRAYRFGAERAYGRRIRFAIRDPVDHKWHWTSIVPGQWVPVSRGGELTIKLSMIMLERGDKPSF